ncbi:Mg2+ transporter protein CorA-like/Zinc transport protein ZntB [Penicillium macrosclerotiorum]|uniref:Mg2+ transporter protein CorA-like/Zinc transport protein ZntB n=1 Tax=Penicillium macrosclerotiorum TaxID=303699 RepID=UPI002547CF23|nr:Mg2+ transporter protein CorA-like/Zinc transport protein ZntB [Penicillium macrosclerotiorum]KAJ5664660.1 Mg2+ transporter protein CorA-like/Zinc transport protein ZntB [Penicillium macrosclerotiorum]
MVNPPPEGLLAWLEHPYPAAPIKDLPRESIETHFVADEQHNQGSGIASDTRNSLDDLLQSYSSANNEFPEAIALPKSLAESSTSTGEPYIEQQSNDHREEDDALRTSLEVCLEPKFSVVPSDIPLPKSRPSSPGQYREELPLVLSGTGPLKEKGRVLSPYKTVIESAGHVLDHIKDGNIVKESRHNRTSITFYDYINNVEAIPRKIFDVENIVPLSYAPPEVKQRLILVEDISKPTIDALGETFSINPEFFEEHLLNSGYAGAEYDQPSTQTWKTRSLEKSYMSLKWIRPVYRLPTYFSNRDLEDLLEDSTEHFTRHGNVKTRVVTNIFRSDWSLSADPAKTVRMKRECGLEERISVWKGKLMNQACDVVIVLLDPLPKITESHRFWTPNNRRGIGDDSGYDFLQESFIADSDDMEDGLHYLFDEEPRRVRDNRRSVEWDDKSQHKVIVEHIAPRRAVIVDLDTVFRTPRSTMKFGKELNETKSTQTEICEGLRFSEGSISLIKPLFHIIKQDTLTLLNQLCRILDEVEVEILDDTKMENRLALWRRLIGRAQRELPELKASLGPFLAFLDTIQSPSATDNCAATKSEVKEDLRKLSTEIDGIVDRLRRTSTYLTSNIGLLDSRRSIDETRAVTRLTELAFVFIPLSFATSFLACKSSPLPIQFLSGNSSLLQLE